MRREKKYKNKNGSSDFSEAVKAATYSIALFSIAIPYTSSEIHVVYESIQDRNSVFLYFCMRPQQQHLITELHPDYI